jgi:hypothetical protein
MKLLQLLTKVVNCLFTKEFLVNGSPSNLPFINGVVLAYNYGITNATAVN